MNNVSWMLYLSSYCGSLGTSLDVLAGLIAAALLACVIGLFALIDDDHEGPMAAKRSLRRWSIGLVCAFVLAIFGNDFVPDKATVLMIAASQAGEKMYQSPDGQEIGHALKDAILAQLKKAQ